MTEVKTYRDLLIWQKAMPMVKRIYLATSRFPAEEVYGLTSQMRRAAVSIPSNIAEGYARKADGDFARFLRIACGSVYELQTQLKIAVDLKYLSANEAETLAADLYEIEKMLSSFIGKMSSRNRIV